VYHITNFQVGGLYATMKKLEKFTLDISSSCTQKYFQRPQNKRIIPLDNDNFNNLHEVTEFEK
jgi:hypothetical protein